MDNVAKEPVETFIDKYVGGGGPGFYLEDGYIQYVVWTKEQFIRPVLGRNAFGNKLEALGLKRGSRRGRVFFEDVRLKSQFAREVYQLAPKE